METHKTIIMILGVFLLAFGIIAVGFTKTVNEILHSDEVQTIFGEVVNVDCRTETHYRRGSRSSYTEYISTITLRNTDPKSDIKTYQIVESSTVYSAHRYKPGTKLTTYELNGKFGLSRDEVYTSKFFNTVGFTMMAVGTSAILIPVMGKRYRRYGY